MTFSIILGVIAGAMYTGYMWLGKMVAEAEVARLDALFQAAGLN